MFSFWAVILKGVVKLQKIYEKCLEIGQFVFPQTEHLAFTARGIENYLDIIYSCEINQEERSCRD